MKKSIPWWWNKMSSAADYPGLLVMDYFLSEFSMSDPVPEPDDRFFCGPGEDIWKKFELLPTPPRSPSRPTSEDDDEDDFCMVTEPKLNLVSDLLDSPDLATWGLCPVTSTGLKNDLLHDCMWSGQCTDTCKRGHTTEPTKCERLPVVKVEQCAPTLPRPLTPSPALPVDPCTMLPYTPLSDHSYHTQQMASRLIQQPVTPPVCDTPSDTEDDEIDVVTLPTSVGLKSIKVEAPEVVPAVSLRKASDSSSSSSSSSTPTRRRPPGRPPTVPPLRLVLPASVSNKRKHKDRRGPGRKRYQKRHGGVSASAQGGWTRRHHKRHSSPPRQQQQQHHQDRTISCSSDSEDCVEKRSMHNSMERKRRDDLRFAFQTLREHVPELASNPKAPKVLILNRAASYARQLSQAGAALERTLRHESSKKKQLERQLLGLKQQLKSMK